MKWFSLDDEMQYMWGFFPTVELSGLCWIPCVWPIPFEHCFGGQRVCKTEQGQSNKARAKEHLCVSGSGAGSLSQGRVKVKAGMGETEEKRAKREDRMSSHTKSRHHWVSSVLVPVRRKGSMSGGASLSLHRAIWLHFPLPLQAPWSASLWVTLGCDCLGHLSSSQLCQSIAACFP